MKALTLFNELWRHGRLADKRHPMYDTNKFGKYAMMVGVICWIGYLIFIGGILAIGMSDESREAYHLLSSGLVFYLALDFIVRIPFQKTPTQEMKPYLLLPVKKHRVIDFLLLRSAFDTFNLLWIPFFAAFALISVTRFYGFTGVALYCFGIWLLTIFNSYWYLLCKTLISNNLCWILLPLAVYSGLALAVFLPDDSPLFYLFMQMGDGFVRGSLLSYLPVLVAIGIMFAIDRSVLRRHVYNELSKVEDVKVHASDYNFFERYGEIGEYMRLELKMLMRNKACKVSLRIVLVITIAFSCLLSFTEIYDDNLMTSFVTVYNFSIFGTLFLINIMSYEGNYIDGLMSRKETVYTLLRAKYLLYSVAVLIPALLMMPAVVMDKVSLSSVVAWALFTIGVSYFGLFQLAVYNKNTAPLNLKISGRQNMGSGMQNLISGISIGMPLMVYPMLNIFFEENTVNLVLSLCGLVFIATSKYWIRNVYHRFMKRRYVNMEGFRNSRQ